MSKNTVDDFNHTWPDLGISKNKITHSEQRTRYQSLSKASGSSIKPEEGNKNPKLKQNVNSNQSNKSSRCRNQFSADDRKPASTTMKYQPSNCPRSDSDEQNVNMLATNTGVVVDICGYWNRIEEFNKHYYQNCNNQPFNKDMNFYNFVTDSRAVQQTDTADSVTKHTLTKEEIAMQRRLKVAEKRQMKKLEKQQLKAIVSGVQAAKPDFSLEQAAEDFPALSSGKKVKKVKKVANESSSKCETENQTMEEGVSTRILEKSWKPKVKDPININISQALQTVKPEKLKPVVKKVDPTSQRSVLVGNTLDSDNPQRKKGKVRPDKVRKPSKLKSLILSERDERRKRILGEQENDGSPLVKEKVQPTLIWSSDYKMDFTDDLSLADCRTCKADPEIQPVLEVQNVDNKSNIVSHSEKSIHSRKFREYCTNCLTEELTAAVCALLEKVAQFQDRTFAQNPIKANAKRRYVAGLHQTNKYLLVKRVKLLVIAPDLEISPGEGGLDEKINSFINEAQSQGIPCVFGPNRKRLGKAVFKNSLVSCVAVLSYDGAQELFYKMQESLDEAKFKYQVLTGNCEVPVAEKEEVPDSLVVKEECSIDEIASALLATLREEVAPADKLLKAIEGCT
uniref:Ribosomal protein eL8/eL30/eS12/Gadd45 domain-containing protein n=1 Tax=Graphocephala atropunctata TaxID=36148 RepID=A0A1B6KUA9_9HEMI